MSHADLHRGRSLRLCHILETSGGGSGRVALDLVSFAAAAGHQVTLIYAPDRAEAWFLAALQNLPSGVRVVPLRMARSVGIRDLFSYGAVCAAFKRMGPFDVIHSHSSKAGGFARLAGWAAPKAVQIYTPHAFVTMAPQRSTLYLAMEKMLAPLADAIICVSEAERRHARDILKIDPRKLHVVPNGVAAEFALRAEARQALQLSDDTTLVGWVGRFAEQKNPLRAVQAFQAATKGRSDIAFLFLGDGPLRPEIEAASSADLRVRFLKGSSKAVFAAFDCFLCSSDYEAFPLVFPEALACGVPIVATPVGGAEECVDEGRTGFVAEAFSAEALAAALAKGLACDRAAFGEKARAKSALYTLPEMHRKTMDVYASCLKARGAI